MNGQPVVLASTSIYRRELLERLRLPFEIAAPGVDESPLPGESPPERARRLGRAKAQAVSDRRPEATVIGSDQVAVCREQVLDKPGTAERCRAQLRWLSGSSATFYTAVSVLAGAGGPSSAFLDTTTVHFRRLAAAEIDRYIQAEQPFDCAGGFRSERLGSSLFERIECEDPTALVGLPLIALARSLREFGYAVP